MTVGHEDVARADRRARLAIAGVIVLGVALRLVVIRAQGFPSDVSTFEAWAERLAQIGPGGFYEPGYFSDYPPGYLYVLWLLGKIFDGEFLRLAVKGMSIPADIAIADIDAAFTVDADEFKSKSRNTPFNGFKLYSKILYTLVDGEIAVEEGVLVK